MRSAETSQAPPGRLSPRRIAEILSAEGLVSQSQLEEALETHAADGKPVDEILVSRGHATAEGIARAISRQTGMRFVVLAEEEPDPEVLGLVEEDVLRRHKAVPLRLEGGSLLCALAEPSDDDARDAIASAVGHPVSYAAAAEDAVLESLDRLFGKRDKRPAGRDAGREPQRGGDLGDVLLQEGLVTEEQLGQARQQGGDVGDALVSLGYATKASLARALAVKHRLDCVEELSEDDVDRAAAQSVDERMLRRHGAVPLRVEDGRLLVAMADPTDLYALEDLRMVSGRSVTPVVATADDVRRVHDRLFAVQKDVSEMLERPDEEDAPDDVEVKLGADAAPDEAPVVRLVGSFLRQAAGEGASDVHVEPQARGLTVRFRVDGVLREAMSVPRRLQGGVIARLKVVAGLNIAERRVPQDGRFSVRVASLNRAVDVRVATLPTAHGEKVVLRLLDTANAGTDLSELGFATDQLDRYQEIYRRPYGTVLVTGPTGSGKSTTLYATLGELNDPGRNVITIEDPVEYRVQGLNQIQVNPRAGLTFASGLRSILRSDPDVIMVGEIRDLETARIAIQSAMTGHMVLATLHTNDAPGAVTRLTEMGVEPFLTASAVDCVIAQRLARKLCDRCKRSADPDREALESANFPFDLAPEKSEFHEAVGCRWCGGSGYRGRVGIFELLVVDDEVRELILGRASAAEVRRAAGRGGMVPLRDDGLLKAARGITTVEEILRTAV